MLNKIFSKLYSHFNAIQANVAYLGAVVSMLCWAPPKKTHTNRLVSINKRIFYFFLFLMLQSGNQKPHNSNHDSNMC